MSRTLLASVSVRAQASGGSQSVTAAPARPMKPDASPETSPLAEAMTAMLRLGDLSATVFTLRSSGTMGSSPSGGTPLSEICVSSVGA